MKEVFVAHLAVDRCEKFAKTVSSLRKKGPRKYGLKTGVDKRLYDARDYSLQYAGRVSEYALCLALELDPLKALDWNTRKSDAGYDIRLEDGRTIDVKASDHPGAYRLIWPVTKRQELFRAADIFVLSRVLPSRRDSMGQIVEFLGCVSKARFINEATTAKNIRGLVDGTLFMERNSLDAITTIRQNHSVEKTTP